MATYVELRQLFGSGDLLNRSLSVAQLTSVSDEAMQTAVDAAVNVFAAGS